jgi:cytochrome c oxidase subunit IV
MFKNLSFLMDDSQIASFVMWSVITGIIMIVSGLSYNAFLKRKNTLS